ETTPDLVGMAWPDGKVFYLNPALTTLLTPPGGDGAIPDTIQHFHPQWAMTKILTEALPAAAAHGTWQGETAFLTGTGQEIPVSQTVTAHRDERGDVKLYSTIARDISAQKALEQELRDRLEFEQLLSRLSTEFVNLPGDALVNGMTQALQEIAEATGAERSYVYLLSEDGTTAHLFSRWTAPHLPPNDDWVTVPVAQFPWWVDQLRQHQVIAIADTADLPPEAVNERRAVAAAGTRSHALVPMYHSQTLLGYIGFSVVTAPKAWSDNEITLLRLVGDLFSNAYQRQQVEGALRQQEHYFRSLTEQSSDIVVLLDETGQVKYITPSATRLLGYPLEEMQGAAALAFIAPEDVERVAAMLQQAAAQPGVSQPIVQYRLRHQDQQWRYYEAIATSLLHDPVVQGIVVNCRDVSDRIGAETARRLSEQVFKGIFEQAAISMAQIALDGTYIRVNPAFCELVGYPAAELIGAHYAKVTHPDDLAHDIALSDEVIEGKVTAQFINKRFVRSDGTIRHVKVVVTAVQGDSNGPAFLASVYNDVTEQVMAEGALRSILEGTASVIGEDFFPVLAQHLAQSLHVDHVLINQLNANHTLTNLVFWSQAQLLPPFSFTAVDTPCERTLQDGFYCCPEAVQAAFPDDPDLALLNAESYLGMALISAQGETLGEICALHSAPMHDLDGIMAILRIFGARVTAELERQQSNAALKANEANWRNILDNMPILLNAVDRHGCFTLWNQECERVTGYSAAEMIGNPHALEMLYPDPRYRQTQMQAWAERGNNYRNWEWKITCKNGRERTIAWSNLSDLFPIPDLGAWGIGVDVTDRRQAENALRPS
ncbi:MAG TPA: PAS domain S-box protein, partial [Candidatus Obscuribacterales bacterium]